MLCRKIRQALIAKPTLKNNVSHNLISYRYFSRKCIFLDSLLAAVGKTESGSAMSTFRVVLRDLSVRRLWSAWTRSFIVNTVVKRIKRDRSVREVIQCFKQAVLKPRRTLLLSTTAAIKANDDHSEKPPSCGQSITDEELQALLSDLENVEELSRTTLLCPVCGMRVVIEKKKLPGIRYCQCKEPGLPQMSADGWLPYMEAEDVIIWRKEYKPGQGLYAYKVYGRYKDVRAEDFAAVQVDGAYRRVWDTAVASLSVVERQAQGLMDQAVLHWEVLWPRLFANRDYVYIRRHKHYDISNTPLKGKEVLSVPLAPLEEKERENVHSNAKRKARENEMKQKDSKAGGMQENKVFVIISRSCEHPAVPESKNCIRVSEYWSHMVVKSLHGIDKPGMEFVLTYYDEPAVGGLPTGVAAWATGRAAPAYLDKMRKAALEYEEWRAVRANQELPDFVSFNPQQQQPCRLYISEEDMESSKEGPELNGAGEEPKRDKSTQTEESSIDNTDDAHDRDSKLKHNIQIEKSDEVREDTTVEETPTINKIEKCDEIKEDATVIETPTVKKDETPLEGESEKSEEDSNSNTCWWRYLYPFYYFS